MDIAIMVIEGFVAFVLISVLVIFAGIVYGYSRRAGIILLLLGLTFMIIILIIGFAFTPTSQIESGWNWGTFIGGFVGGFFSPMIFQIGKDVGEEWRS